MSWTPTTPRTPMSPMVVTPAAPAPLTPARQKIATSWQPPSSPSPSLSKDVSDESFKMLWKEDKLDIYTIPMLKNFLRTHKLLLSGSKPVLISRIKEYFCKIP